MYTNERARLDRGHHVARRNRNDRAYHASPSERARTLSMLTSALLLHHPAPPKRQQGRSHWPNAGARPRRSYATRCYKSHPDLSLTPHSLTHSLTHSPPISHRSTKAQLLPRSRMGRRALARGHRAERASSCSPQSSFAIPFISIRIP
jgi:hypothetical protein